MMYKFKCTHRFTSMHTIPGCSSSNASSLTRCLSQQLDIRACHQGDQQSCLSDDRQLALLGGLQELVGLQQINTFLCSHQLLHWGHDGAEPCIPITDEVLGWPMLYRCKGADAIHPNTTASLTCNRSTWKGRLASTFYQEAVSRLVTSPRSGRPICPPSVTGKPVKPNLLFNSSSSFRKHPTSISAERGFTHQTPHYGQMA